MTRIYEYNLSQRWDQIVENNPNKKALIYSNKTEVTFSELNLVSNGWINFLAKLGIRKYEVIAIANQKSPAAFALMLACIRSGFVYVNLDASSPAERIKKMLETAKPKALFLDQGVSIDFSGPISCPIIPISNSLILSFKEESRQRSSFDLSMSEILGSDPVYIMFTSGSTGFPKGAVMSHANVLNLIHWSQETYNFSKDEILTNLNPIYFDNSVFDFYSALFNGLTLAPFTTDETKDPAVLVKKVEQLGCTSWFSVPSLLVYLLTMRALHSGSLPAIKRFIFGGEGFPKNKLRELFDQFSPIAALFNVYGPTECTCICSSYKVQLSDFDDMNALTTLGSMAPNFSFALRDEDGEIHFQEKQSFSESNYSTSKTESNPVLKKGELLIYGPNVGLGYYNDQERTAKSFLTDHSKGVPIKFYATGDLVQVDEKDQLHFKGRIDYQVKHMGYRIELEEIEAAFQSQTSVNEVGVVYHTPKSGLNKIVAFVSLREIDQLETVKQRIRQILPSYMVPKEIVLKEVLPKNQNGKINRLALKEELK